MKNIQKTLGQITMNLQNIPFQSKLSQAYTAEMNVTESDPSAWFRSDPDVWAPPFPTNRDPDVWPPPTAADHSRSGPPRIAKTLNRKTEVNRKNAATKSASSVTTTNTSTLRRTRATINGKVTSANSKKPGTAGSTTHENGSKEKTDKEKEDDAAKDEDSHEDDRKFEPSSHADVDLVDMLGNMVILFSIKLLSFSIKFL